MKYIAFLLSLLCFQPLLFSMNLGGSQKSVMKPLSLRVPSGLFDQSYPLTEMKAGYFFFASSQMRDVYSKGGFSLQLSGSYPVYECLELYGSMGYLQAWGNSQGANQSTTLWQIPVDIGLKPIFNIASFVQYYIAIGPRYFYVHQQNDSSFVNQNFSRNGIGFFVNTGFNFYLTRHFFIDLFGEYAYEPTSFSSGKPNVFGQSFQVSPANFGLSIGYAF